jgi:hypothetical protein
MARFVCFIGISSTTEVTPGVHKEIFTEKRYKCDILRDTRRWENAQKVNDNLIVSNRISIVADAYAYEHFSAIRYVKWEGVSWEISSIEIQRPRLILTLGGIFNVSQD